MSKIRVKVKAQKSVKKAPKPTKRLSHPCESCAEFTCIGEGDHICGFDPTRMPVSEYIPTDDYFWCNGKHFWKWGDT